MAITVRSAGPDDLDQLRAHQARPELNLVDTHFDLQQAGKLILAAAFDDDLPLGTAVLDFDAAELTPELRNMYVYPAARRRGAARALSQYLETHARKAGYTSVYLAVDPNNERAVPLYVSLDYAPTGEHLFVEDPEVQQVENGRASTHYAIYKKSLTIR